MEQLAPHFWTVRGTFRVAGVIDIGTQMSLVRREDGRFVLLDSYESATAFAAIDGLTDGGRAIEAIVNVHPFHTLHCRAVHRRYPHAELIGTARHQRLQPDLPWSPQPIEHPASWRRFAPDLAFMLPSGVDFAPADERVHVGSVLVRHRPSRIVHVDDTLNVFAPPAALQPLLRPWLGKPRLRFHPMLAKALEKRPGAADAFAQWARELASEWADTAVVCAAHSQVHRPGAAGFADEVTAALQKVAPVLAAHRARYG